MNTECSPSVKRSRAKAARDFTLNFFFLHFVGSIPFDKIPSSVKVAYFTDKILEQSERGRQGTLSVRRNACGANIPDETRKETQSCSKLQHLDDANRTEWKTKNALKLPKSYPEYRLRLRLQHPEFNDVYPLFGGIHIRTGMVGQVLHCTLY